MTRILTTTIGFLILSALQVSLLPRFSITELVLLPIVAILYVLEFGSRTTVYTAALVSAFSLSLFANTPFPAYLAAFVLVVLLSEFLYGRFFTNRSIYGTLTLTVLATAVFEMTLLLFRIFFSDVYVASFAIEFLHLFHRVIGNLLAMIVVFYAGYFFSQFFRSIFFVRQARQKLH